MTPDAKKKLIGALIAAALAIAVYYGLIDQKQADNIRNQTDQTLGTGAQPPQQSTPAPQPSQAPAPKAPAPDAPAAPQTTTPAPAPTSPQATPPRTEAPASNTPAPQQSPPTAPRQ